MRIVLKKIPLTPPDERAGFNPDEAEEVGTFDSDVGIGNFLLRMEPMERLWVDDAMIIVAARVWKGEGVRVYEDDSPMTNCYIEVYAQVVPKDRKKAMEEAQAAQAKQAGKIAIVEDPRAAKKILKT